MNDWFLIAERYGWTPDEVNALPLEFAEVLPHLISSYAEAQNRRNAPRAGPADLPRRPGRPGMAG